MATGQTILFRSCSSCQPHRVDEQTYFFLLLTQFTLVTRNQWTLFLVSLPKVLTWNAPFFWGSFWTESLTEQFIVWADVVPVVYPVGLRPPWNKKQVHSIGSSSRAEILRNPFRNFHFTEGKKKPQIAGDVGQPILANGRRPIGGHVTVIWLSLWSRVMAMRVQGMNGGPKRFW